MFLGLFTILTLTQIVAFVSEKSIVKKTEIHNMEGHSYFSTLWIQWWEELCAHSFTVQFTLQICLGLVILSSWSGAVRSDRIVPSTYCTLSNYGLKKGDTESWDPQDLAGSS